MHTHTHTFTLHSSKTQNGRLKHLRQSCLRRTQFLDRKQFFTLTRVYVQTQSCTLRLHTNKSPIHLFLCRHINIIANFIVYCHQPLSRKYFALIYSTTTPDSVEHIIYNVEYGNTCNLHGQFPIKYCVINMLGQNWFGEQFLLNSLPTKHSQNLMVGTFIGQYILIHQAHMTDM